MSVTRAQYVIACLAGLGNLIPTAQTRQFGVNWTTLESSPPGAENNLLNCTLPQPGSTYFNVLERDSKGNPTFGVQNYPTLAEGVAAFTLTVRNGRYPSLLLALSTNDAAALGMTTGTPSPGVMSDLRTWTGGSGYNPAQVSGNGNEVFSWSGTPAPAPTGGAPVSSPAPTNGNPPSITGIAPIDNLLQPFYGLSQAQTAVSNALTPFAQLAQTLNGISNWTSNPNRIIKLVAGILLLVFALLLLTTDIVESFAKSPVGQAATKAAALGAA